MFDLCDSPHDAVARGLNTSLSPDNVDTLHKKFPSMFTSWERRQTVHACIHAELRIILPLGLASALGCDHPIGVRKRSCLCCALWIGSHNYKFGTQWSTSGSHGKPYANWALPGTACGYAVGEDGRSSTDIDVSRGVSIRLEDALCWLRPGDGMISDDYVSSEQSAPIGASQFLQDMSELRE